MSRRSGLAVGTQVFDTEWSRVDQVSVQGQQQRRAFLHDSHSGMTVAMNPTLMALGLAKPTLQIEVVTRQVRLVTSDEQSRLEAPHYHRHLLPDRVRFGFQTLSQRREDDATLI